MAENTAIEWADHTFNPWLGCTKVSPACDHCYAEARMDTRLHVVQWGAGQWRKRTGESYWRLPLKWNREAEAFQAQHGRRQRVFCASLADVFDNEVDPAWRRDLFALIEKTPNLDWLLLTKRIGNAARSIEYTTFPKEWAWPWPNVWIGATICNQAEADRDIPKLLAVPAAKRFLSIEPMLGPVDLRWALPDIRTACCHRCGFRTNRVGGACPNDGETLRGDIGIDWVIVGGESGPHARPMHPGWVRSLRDQCNAAGVPFFFKQWGEWAFVPYTDSRRGWNPISGREHLFKDGPEDEHTLMERVGKKAAGRLLDGREWSEVPA